MLHVRMAAFPTIADAQEARRELTQPPDGIAQVMVRPRSRRSPLLHAWQSLVRTRARRALLVGLCLGLLVAGGISAAYLLAGFERVTVLALAVGAMAVTAGAVIGWLVGAYLISLRFYRVLRAAPSAAALLTARVRTQAQRHRFEDVCEAHGALASAAA